MDLSNWNWYTGTSGTIHNQTSFQSKHNTLLSSSLSLFMMIFPSLKALITSMISKILFNLNSCLHRPLYTLLPGIPVAFMLCIISQTINKDLTTCQRKKNTCVQAHTHSTEIMWQSFIPIKSNISRWWPVTWVYGRISTQLIRV